MGAGDRSAVRTHGIFLSRASVVFYEINVPTEAAVSLPSPAISTP